MTLKNKLKKIRLKEGYTHRQLAKISGVSQGTIHKAEQQGNGVNLETAYKISEAFKTDVYAIWEIK